jgi:nucleotide-binding universal stress UspA family protein
VNLQLILHPTDGSEQSKKALEYAAELAVSTKAKLLLLHVQRRHGIERIPREMVEFERLEHIRMTEADLLRSAAEFIVDEAKQAAKAKGVKDIETLIVEGDSTTHIIDTAKARAADAIVMGCRGLGELEGLLLGSVSHKVVQAAPCTCVVVR